MAKTVYDYWFVQFDFPDTNGNPYKSSGGKMVYDEKLKREIPEGWESKELDEYAKFLNGKGIKNIVMKENGIFDVFGSNGRIGKTNKALFMDPVISIGRVGANYGEVHYSLKPCWISDNAVTSQPIDPINFWWLLHSLELINYSYIAGGSAQPLITQGKLKKMLFPVPDNRIFKFYYESIGASFLQIQNNNNKNETLIKLRDWLLPMLMNGQVTVKEAHEKMQMNMAAEPKAEYTTND